MKIFNVLYPTSRDAPDHEIERLDGVVLRSGTVKINRCYYYLSRLGPPEYESYGQECQSITYRWLMKPLKGSYPK